MMFPLSTPHTLVSAFPPASASLLFLHSIGSDPSPHCSFLLVFPPLPLSPGIPV